VAADAGRTEVNLMPSLLDAARARATVGEVVDVLEGVFGTYTETVVV
jgi:methylmalonyl-CoA mutase N-terminal domain/subunit